MNSRNLFFYIDISSKPLNSFCWLCYCFFHLNQTEILHQLSLFLTFFHELFFISFPLSEVAVPCKPVEEPNHGQVSDHMPQLFGLSKMTSICPCIPNKKVFFSTRGDSIILQIKICFVISPSLLDTRLEALIKKVTSLAGSLYNSC